MADVAQLVRASVCGTECRRFESGHPPHEFEKHPNGVFFEFTVCCVWVRTGEAAGSKYWTKANGSAPVHRSFNEGGWDNIGAAIRSSAFASLQRDRSGFFSLHQDKFVYCKNRD